MISVDEALQYVLTGVAPNLPEQVPLREVLGCTLAEDVASDCDSPPHDKSLVDGYAVQASDFVQRGAPRPAGTVELAVIEEVTAGRVPEQSVCAGRAIRVMTGAPIPAGADAVVMLEQTSLLDEPSLPLGVVRFATTDVRLGQHIMPRATSLRRGQVVLTSGRPLGCSDIGLLAEVGRQSVAVCSRPRVAVLPTGNELVEPGIEPGPGKIRNSNGPMLCACARQAGAAVSDLGIGRDDEDHLAELVQRGLAADILLISGGVSAGVLDLVPKVLDGARVEKIFHGVRLKPGKPLWFGIRQHQAAETVEAPATRVFGLPGNPVSSLVCFELFVRPLIAQLAGRDQSRPLVYPAVLSQPYEHRGDRPTYHPARYHPARLQDHDGRATVEPTAWHGSADLRTLVDANALAIFPPGDRQYAAGDVIDCRLLPTSELFVWP